MIFKKNHKPYRLYAFSILFIVLIFNSVNFCSTNDESCDDCQHDCNKDYIKCLIIADMHQDSYLKYLACEECKEDHERCPCSYACSENKPEDTPSGCEF